MAKAQEDKTEGTEEKTPAVGDKSEGVGTVEEVKRAHTEPILYLFGRTGRDKEEWFKRMLFASKLKSESRKPLDLPTSKSETYSLNYTGSCFSNKQTKYVNGALIDCSHIYTVGIFVCVQLNLATTLSKVYIHSVLHLDFYTFYISIHVP